MKRWIATLVIGVTLAATVFPGPTTARADNPPYVLLQPANSGYGYPAQPQPQPYAYGWFGACPQRFFTFHWSYYNDRWIWW